MADYEYMVQFTHTDGSKVPAACPLGREYAFTLAKTAIERDDVTQAFVAKRDPGTDTFRQVGPTLIAGR